MALAEITHAFQQQIQADITKDNFCLISSIYIKMGKKAYGISAGAGETHFTVRTDKNEQMKKIEAALEDTARKIAQKHQLDNCQ